MRNAKICGVLVGAALLATVAISACVRESEQKLAAKPTPAAASDEVESGVYGFSGAIKGGTPSGVMGECIWIYDADNNKQIAKGDCDQGNFRVVLRPGTYVVRGPGGNQKIEIKPHQWIKIKSLVELPGSL
ncbi:MAG: hypothetical protein WB580_11075 [Candidatus Binataceae bacterium]